MPSRRRFLGGLGASAFAAPVVAEAQQAGKVYTIGVLSLGFPDSGRLWWGAFLEAMRELNYVQERNLVVKFAFASGQPERLPSLAGDLVRAGVAVIVTTAERETRAARQATSTTPIVMT